jgi:signal transduction histidine kinase
MKIIEYLSKRSRAFLILASLILILIVGIFDYLTGPEMSFSVFYLLPISLSAWFLGKRAGIATSAACACVGMITDLLSGHIYSHPAMPYWDAIVRLSFFLIVTYALSGLKASRERQKELSQFIVHDLRSPLSAVMMGLEALHETGVETMDEAQQGLVQMCRVSCTRMLTLVNSLLDLARLEAGHMLLQMREVNVKELIESSLGQMSIWAERNHVRLDLDIEPSVATVYTDPELAERVLVNLLSNAIKFSGPNSVISVRVAPSDAAMVTFCVIDHGRGIPQEWTDRVFDKFAQVEARKTQVPVPSSGLGLTFCRQAVESLGGRIWLDSHELQGTTVTFTLPTSVQARSG